MQQDNKLTAITFTEENGDQVEVEDDVSVKPVWTDTYILYMGQAYVGGFLKYMTWSSGLDREMLN